MRLIRLGLVNYGLSVPRWVEQLRPKLERYWVEILPGSFAFWGSAKIFARFEMSFCSECKLSVKRAKVLLQF